MVKGAPHDCLHVPRKHRGRILVGLPFAHLSRRSIDGNALAAHIRYCGFKGKAGPRRRFIKKHRHGLRPL